MICNIESPMDCKGWYVEDAEIVDERYGLKRLICGDFSVALGTVITHTLRNSESNVVTTVIIKKEDMYLLIYMAELTMNLKFFLKKLISENLTIVTINLLFHP